MLRVGGDTERSCHFNARPVFIIAPDCPYVACGWLWWTVRVWLLPHTAEQAEAALAKMSGRSLVEVAGSFEHWTQCLK